MKQKFLLPACFILFLLVYGCANKTEVKQQQVGRIIKTLSADEMKGRHAFSSEIKKAADFIAEEFQKIGLHSLPSEDDYFQEFTIFSITPAKSTVRINGKNLTEQYFFGLLKEQSFLWNTSDAQLQYISSEDNFRTKFREFVSND